MCNDFIVCPPKPPLKSTTLKLMQLCKKDKLRTTTFMLLVRAVLLYKTKEGVYLMYCWVELFFISTKPSRN